jgi:hypothetical protein
MRINRSKRKKIARMRDTAEKERQQNRASIDPRGEAQRQQLWQEAKQQEEKQSAAEQARYKAQLNERIEASKAEDASVGQKLAGASARQKKTITGIVDRRDAKYDSKQEKSRAKEETRKAEKKQDGLKSVYRGVQRGEINAASLGSTEGLRGLLGQEKISLDEFKRIAELQKDSEASPEEFAEALAPTSYNRGEKLADAVHNRAVSSTIVTGGRAVKARAGQLSDDVSNRVDASKDAVGDRVNALNPLYSDSGGIKAANKKLEKGSLDAGGKIALMEKMLEAARIKELAAHQKDKREAPASAAAPGSRRNLLASQISGRGTGLTLEEGNRLFEEKVQAIHPGAQTSPGHFYCSHCNKHLEVAHTLTKKEQGE